MIILHSSFCILNHRVDFLILQLLGGAVQGHGGHAAGDGELFIAGEDFRQLQSAGDHGGAGGLLSERCSASVRRFRDPGDSGLCNRHDPAYLEAEHAAEYWRRHRLLHAAGTASLLKSIIPIRLRMNPVMRRLFL